MCNIHMDMPIDTKTKQHMDECRDLIALVQSCQEGITPEFRRRCREQLRECVGKLWTDHANHMGSKQAKGMLSGRFFTTGSVRCELSDPCGHPSVGAKVQGLVPV